MAIYQPNRIATTICQPWIGFSIKSNSIIPLPEEDGDGNGESNGPHLQVGQDFDSGRNVFGPRPTSVEVEIEMNNISMMKREAEIRSAIRDQSYKTFLHLAEEAVLLYGIF